MVYMYVIWEGKKREADSAQPPHQGEVPSKLVSESWLSPLSLSHFRRGIDERSKDSLRTPQRVIHPISTCLSPCMEA